MLHKNKMGLTITFTGTAFYSLLYFNSQTGFHGLKDMYSVISVICRFTTWQYQKSGIDPLEDGQSLISPSLSGRQMTSVEQDCSEGPLCCLLYFCLTFCCALPLFPCTPHSQWIFRAFTLCLLSLLLSLAPPLFFFA